MAILSCLKAKGEGQIRAEHTELVPKLAKALNIPEEIQRDTWMADVLGDLPKDALRAMSPPPTAAGASDRHSTTPNDGEEDGGKKRRSSMLPEIVLQVSAAAWEFGLGKSDLGSITKEQDTRPTSTIRHRWAQFWTAVTRTASGWRLSCERSHRRADSEFIIMAGTGDSTSGSR